VTPDNPDPAVHQMTHWADDTAASGLSFATDRLAMNIHGDADSHLDALCHVIFDGKLYNGVDAGAVTAAGAAELSIDVAAQGIAGRGLLLDIPRVRGVPWLEPGDHVTVGDLLAAESAATDRIEQGDLLLVRVGHRARRRSLGPWDAAGARAGLHPSALELLAERRIAVLGSDGNSDTAPSMAEGVDFPVHVLAINAMGLHLLDYLDLDALTESCGQLRRWSFFCVVAPLRLRAGTGSPVNPIAIFLPKPAPRPRPRPPDHPARGMPPAHRANEDGGWARYQSLRGDLKGTGCRSTSHAGSSRSRRSTTSCSSRSRSGWPS
jgi:kynurenine formamidase